MRFCSLSSSSTYGNAFLVQSGRTVLLVDCGLPLRRLDRTASAMGVDLERVGALMVTHHHWDHTRALRLKGPLARRYGTPVYASGEFWAFWGRESVRRGYGSLEGLTHEVRPGQTVDVDGLSVTAFDRPHDAMGSLGYLVQSRDQAVAILTDMGHAPRPLLASLRGIDHLIIEANHDVDMEERSARPRSLKDRVMGPWGHLSNDQAGEALAETVTADTRTVLLAHLSLDCNRPSRAVQAVSRHLAHRPTLDVAPADHPSPWMGDAR